MQLENVMKTTVR